MNCRNAVVLMHDYLDDDLDELLTSDLFSHIKGCEKCNSHFAELQVAENFLRQLKIDTVAPDYLKRVKQQLSEKGKIKNTNRWFRRHPGLAAASIFLFLFSMSLFSYYTPNSDFRVVAEEQNNLVVDGKSVIVPEGMSLKGDLVVENGDLEINGKVKGDVTVINGRLLMANASNVDGSTKQIDQLFEWLWYKINTVWSF